MAANGLESGHTRTSGPSQVSERPVAGDTDREGAVYLLLGRTAVRLVLTGEIDGSVHADLVTAVDEAIASGRSVQVDARHVRFMDSSGIAMIAHLAQRVDSRLTLIQPPDVVRFLLEVTNLGEVVDVTEEDPGLASA